MSTKTLLTADELEQMPDDDSVQVELDQGELITMPPASGEHGDSETRIVVALFSFVDPKLLGSVYTGDTGFRLSDNTVRVPDVAFVRKSRVKDMQGQGFMKGAPDLAVEIFSPSNSVAQLMRKVKQYFAAGCEVVWVAYPERREIHVWERNGMDRILSAADTLECPELLPGFSITVSKLFKS